MPLAHSAQAHQAPHKERPDDRYDTPLVAVRALLRCEQLPRRIWEPAAGKGNIVLPLRAAGHEVLASDLNDRGCPDSLSGFDFLLPTATEPVDAIVTNPPFALATQFVALALERAPLVVMLLRFAFFEAGTGNSERSRLRKHVLECGKLARIHVFANRLPMMHREGWTGKKASSGMTFAWFVWDAAHSGPVTIDRIYWTPLIGENDPAADPASWLGPDERKRLEVKAHNLPPDYGPLFGGDNESQHQRHEPTGS